MSGSWGCSSCFNRYVRAWGGVGWGGGWVGLITFHCLTPLQVLQALKVWCHAGISKKISAYVPGLPSVILSSGRLCYTSSNHVWAWGGVWWGGGWVGLITFHCLTPLQVLQALKVWCHAGISKKISAYVPGLPSVILSSGRLCYTSSNHSKTMTNWKAIIFVVSQDMAGCGSLCRKHVQTMLSIAQQSLRCGCWKCQDHECEHASFWNYRSGWNFNSHHSGWLSQSHFSTPGESVEGYAHFQWKATAEIFPPACTFSWSCGTWKVSKPRAGSSTIQISFCWSKATDRKLGRHLFYQVAAASPNRVETVSQPNFDGRWCKSMEWSCACWRKKTEN